MTQPEGRKKLENQYTSLVYSLLMDSDYEALDDKFVIRALELAYSKLWEAANLPYFEINLRDFKRLLAVAGQIDLAQWLEAEAKSYTAILGDPLDQYLVGYSRVARNRSDWLCTQLQRFKGQIQREFHDRMRDFRTSGEEILREQESQNPRPGPESALVADFIERFRDRYYIVLRNNKHQKTLRLRIEDVLVSPQDRRLALKVHQTTWVAEKLIDNTPDHWDVDDLLELLISGRGELWEGDPWTDRQARERTTEERRFLEEVLRRIRTINAEEDSTSG